MAKYKIEVIMQEDKEMKLQGTPYFWCILIKNQKTWINDECGWSESPEKAFKDALDYYNANLKK